MRAIILSALLAPSAAVMLKNAKHDLPLYCGRMGTFGVTECVEKELKAYRAVFFIGACPDGSDLLIEMTPTKSGAQIHVEDGACS